MERTATCHCGQLKVVASGEPERVYLCHCKACQRRTSTAFHFGTRWLKDQVRIEGAYKVYERGADSGTRIRFCFCPSCGSNLSWESDRNPAYCGVAAGAFEERNLPSPNVSIFEEEMHAWLGLPTIVDHHAKGFPAAPVSGQAR